MNPVLFILRHKAAEYLKGGYHEKGKNLFLLNMFNSSASPCSRKAHEKSYNVSLPNMKADTSGTFNKSQRSCLCCDVDCHSPPPRHQPRRVQSCAFSSSSGGPRLTDTFSLKSRRYSVDCVNVSVTLFGECWVPALSTSVCGTDADSCVRARSQWEFVTRRL